MNHLAAIVNFFQTGGIFMYPILFILAIGTAIIFERFLVIIRSRTNGEKVWNQLHGYLQTNRLDEAIRTCGRYSAPLYLLLGSGIRGLKEYNSREDIQGTLEESMAKIVPRVEARLHYLPSLASVATLLGLLGTIIGLIQAFTAVSVADPSQKAALLSKGISVAMNTTAFGLMVAIPLMLMYAFLQTRTDRVVDTLEEFGLRLLNQSSLLLLERDKFRGQSANGGDPFRRTQSPLTPQKGVAHAK